MKLKFHTYQHGLRLIISSKNPTGQDFIEIPRFELMQELATGETKLLVSENWDDIQDKIEEVVKDAE